MIYLLLYYLERFGDPVEHTQQSGHPKIGVER